MRNVQSETALGRLTDAERAEAAQEFQRLAAEWREAGRFLSSTTELAMLPSYQRIIGMGEVAVPLILHELERQPEQWFWALKAITGADPVPPDDRGRTRRMAEAWIAWGRSNGYR